METRDPYRGLNVRPDEFIQTPEWWGFVDYVALSIALFQSIAVPFLALAVFFLLISVVVTWLGG